MLDIEKLTSGIAALVAKAVADATAPLLARIEVLEKAAPAAHVTGAVIDRAGDLILTLSNGEAKSLGRVVGKDGDPGKDGADGLGFEDLEFACDEAGRAVAIFARGEVSKSITLPGMIDRGPWRVSETYQKGDAVSYGGSLWIAQAETKDRPDGGAGWRLAVKKGRDGKDADREGR